MQVKRVIFIRPGETDWNKVNRWQGWVACPLNSHGRAQVAALANFMRNIGVGAVYSSDLQRAKDTAEIIAAKLGFEPIYDERLRERSIGTWQGMTPEELEAWYPDQYKALRSDSEHYVIPGGESLDHVKARSYAAFEQIIKDDKAETVGVITHTVTIRSLMQRLVGEDSTALKLVNSSVSTIAHDGEKWRIIALNDAMHLEGLTSSPIREAGDKS